MDAILSIIGVAIWACVLEKVNSSIQTQRMDVYGLFKSKVWKCTMSYRNRIALRNTCTRYKRRTIWLPITERKTAERGASKVPQKPKEEKLVISRKCLPTIGADGDCWRKYAYIAKPIKTGEELDLMQFMQHIHSKRYNDLPKDIGDTVLLVLGVLLFGFTDFWAYPGYVYKFVLPVAAYAVMMYYMCVTLNPCALLKLSPLGEGSVHLESVEWLDKRPMNLGLKWDVYHMTGADTSQSNETAERGLPEQEVLDVLIDHFFGSHRRDEVYRCLVDLEEQMPVDSIPQSWLDSKPFDFLGKATVVEPTPPGSIGLTYSISGRNYLHCLCMCKTQKTAFPRIGASMQNLLSIVSQVHAGHNAGEQLANMEIALIDDCRKEAPFGIRPEQRSSAIQHGINFDVENERAHPHPANYAFRRKMIRRVAEKLKAGERYALMWMKDNDTVFFETRTKGKLVQRCNPNLTVRDSDRYATSTFRNMPKGCSAETVFMDGVLQYLTPDNVASFMVLNPEVKRLYVTGYLPKEAPDREISTDPMYELEYWRDQVLVYLEGDRENPYIQPIAGNDWMNINRVSAVCETEKVEVASIFNLFLQGVCWLIDWVTFKTSVDIEGGWAQMDRLQRASVARNIREVIRSRAEFMSIPEQEALAKSFLWKLTHRVNRRWGYFRYKAPKDVKVPGYKQFSLAVSMIESASMHKTFLIVRDDARLAIDDKVRASGYETSYQLPIETTEMGLVNVRIPLNTWESAVAYAGNLYDARVENISAKIDVVQSKGAFRVQARYVMLVREFIYEYVKASKENKVDAEGVFELRKFLRQLIKSRRWAIARKARLVAIISSTFKSIGVFQAIYNFSPFTPDPEHYTKCQGSTPFADGLFNGPAFTWPINLVAGIARQVLFPEIGWTVSDVGILGFPVMPGDGNDQQPIVPEIGLERNRTNWFENGTIRHSDSPMFKDHSGLSAKCSTMFEYDWPRVFYWSGWTYRFSMLNDIRKPLGLSWLTIFLIVLTTLSFLIETWVLRTGPRNMYIVRVVMNLKPMTKLHECKEVIASALNIGYDNVWEDESEELRLARRVDALRSVNEGVSDQDIMEYLQKQKHAEQQAFLSKKRTTIPFFVAGKGLRHDKHKMTVKGPLPNVSETHLGPFESDNRCGLRALADASGISIDRLVQGFYTLFKDPDTILASGGLDQEALAVMFATYGYQLNLYTDEYLYKFYESVPGLTSVDVKYDERHYSLIRKVELPSSVGGNAKCDLGSDPSDDALSQFEKDLINFSSKDGMMVQANKWKRLRVDFERGKKLADEYKSGDSGLIASMAALGMREDPKCLSDSIKTAMGRNSVKRTVNALYIAGFAGSRKSSALIEFLRTRDMASEHIMWITPKRVLMQDTLDKLSKGVDKSYREKLRSKVTTYENALFRPNTVAIVDEISQYDPGYIELLLARNPMMNTLVIVGDPCQGLKRAESLNSQLITMRAEAEFYLPLVDYYCDWTYRLSEKMAARLGVKTYSGRQGTEPMESIYTGGLRLMPSLAKAQDGGKMDLTYNQCQGLTVPDGENLHIELTNASSKLSQNQQLVAVTRAENRITYSGVLNQKGLIECLFRKVNYRDYFEILKTVKLEETPKVKVIGGSDYQKRAGPYVLTSHTQDHLQYAGCKTKLTSVEMPWSSMGRFVASMGSGFNKARLTEMNKDPDALEVDGTQTHIAGRNTKQDGVMISEMLTQYRKDDDAAKKLTVKTRTANATPTANLVEYAKSIPYGKDLFMQYKKYYLTGEVQETDDNEILRELLLACLYKKPISQNMNKEFDNTADRAMNELRVFMKNGAKVTEEKYAQVAKGGQLVLTYPEVYRVIGAFMIRKVETYEKPLLRKRSFDMRGATIDNLDAFCKANVKSEAYTIDYTKWDQSSRGASIAFQRARAMNAGISSSDFDFYIKPKLSKTIGKRTLRTAMDSGEPGTYDWNTSWNRAVTLLIFHMNEDSVNVTAGDDGTVWNAKINLAYKSILKTLHLKIKLGREANPRFCGMVLSEHGASPDPNDIALKIERAIQLRNFDNVVVSYAFSAHHIRKSQWWLYAIDRNYLESINAIEGLLGSTKLGNDIMMSGRIPGNLTGRLRRIAIRSIRRIEEEFKIVTYKGLTRVEF